MKRRGFVTIATGQKRYYRLAKNLLDSYRYFASVKYPFAILCDEENEYTKAFDKTIILKNPHKNYLDKLSLYQYLPYDETIFIDADSLAYGDLDEWWLIFEKGDDFSVFGYMWTNLKLKRGWFDYDGIKEFKNKVSYIPDFNGGVYYLRKSEICEGIFRLANYLAKHYAEYRFNGFVTPADEPVLALAMAVYKCRPVDLLDGGIAFAPKSDGDKIDISIPKAVYSYDNKQMYLANIVHWSNYRTMLSMYRFEVSKLNYLLSTGSTRKTAILSKGGWRWHILYERKLLLYLMKPLDIFPFCRRAIRYLNGRIRAVRI